MISVLEKRDTVCNLRVKTAKGFDSRARMALTRSLADLDLRPPLMPPSAVLFVRYLLDPIPGALVDNNKRSRWKSAVRESLSTLYSEAARPQNGTVVGEPKAVVFKDQAELLASLLIDICVGNSVEKWWWRSRQLPNVRPSVLITQCLMQEVQYIPAVFNHLADVGQSVEIVRKLDSHDAFSLTQAMLHTFQLVPLCNELIFVGDQVSGDASHSPVSKHSSETLSEFEKIDQPHRLQGLFASKEINPPNFPPWLTLFHAEIWQANLSKEQAVLLGLARTLQDRPAMMRNPSFQSAILSWWKCEVSKEIEVVRGREGDQDISGVADNLNNNEKERLSLGRSTPDSDNAGYQSELSRYEACRKKYARTDNHHRRDASFCDTSAFPEPESTIDDSSGNKERNKPPYSKLLSILDSESRRDQRANRTKQDNGADLAIGKEISFIENSKINHFVDEENCNEHLISKNKSDARQESRNAEIDEKILDKVDDRALYFSELFFDTELAGIFYLINLFEQLDFSACFEEDWKLTKQLSPWALLDVVARALLSNNFYLSLNDPIWTLLAKLDGRRSKLKIGNGFKSKRQYILPKSWFDYLLLEQRDTIFWALHKENLRIWTPGILLAEIPLEENPEDSCRALISSFGANHLSYKLEQTSYKDAPVDNARRLRKLGMNFDLSYCLSRVTPIIRFVLQYKLEYDCLLTRKISKKMLMLQARIYATSSHIDVVSDVNNTDLKLRRAGLDQNPGWLPDYGRVVLLHFV